MCASSWGTVVLGDARINMNRDLVVGILVLLVLGKTIVGAVERKPGNVSIPLDTSSLLQTAGKILRDVAEDGDLALDDLLLAASAHVARDVLDKALLGTIVEDLLPQGTRSVEVLLANLGQEGDGLA